MEIIILMFIVSAAPKSALALARPTAASGADPGSAAQTSTWTLETLPTGQRAVIEDIAAPSNDALLRLREMGLTPGTAVSVTRRGWGGDPLELQVRGTRLCIRRAHATTVTVSAAHRGSKTP